MEIKIKNLTFRDNLINLNHTFTGITSIIGPSGSGKTLLLNLIYYLEKPTLGTIEVIKETMDKDTATDIRKKMGYLTQNTQLCFFEKNIRDEIKANLIRNNQYLNKIEQRVKETIKIVGLSLKHLDCNPNELSNGEKTLLSLALVLSTNPKIILLDEPTIGLDYQGKKHLIKLLKKINREYHKLIIVASNDIEFIHELGNNLVILNNGKIIEAGKTIEVIKDIQLLKENGIEVPKIIEFIELVKKKKNINLDPTNEIKELMKDIYRHVY